MLLYIFLLYSITVAALEDSMTSEVSFFLPIISLVLYILMPYTIISKLLVIVTFCIGLIPTKLPFGEIDLFYFIILIKSCNPINFLIISTISAIFTSTEKKVPFVMPMLLAHLFICQY